MSPSQRDRLVASAVLTGVLLGCAATASPSALRTTASIAPTATVNGTFAAGTLRSKR
jgi:hypothetical protein